MGKGPLKRLRLENHKGILSLAVSPDGKSLRLEGANGVGKSSVIDGLEWIVSDDGSEAGMRNGAEIRYGEMVFGEYLITRRQRRGGKPSRNVPASALAEVRAALSRKTFSGMGEAEQVAVLKKLAPGLDVSVLEAQEKRLYDERTGLNRDAKALRAQVDGVQVPAAPEEIGEEWPVVDVIDVAAIAAKKGDVERVRAENAAARRAADDSARHAEQMQLDASKAVEEVLRLEAALAEAKRRAVVLQEEQAKAAERARRSRQAAQELVDPDTTAIDAEIAAARQKNATARAEIEAHNRTVRQRQQQAADAKRAAAERDRLAAQAAAKEAESRALTERMAVLERQRLDALSAAAVPIVGLRLVDGRVMWDDGRSGPVPISDAEDTPNAGERMRINIAVHAALGHKIVAVRNASLMDEDTRAAAEKFAAERGIQLISEIVRRGAPLTAVIEEESDPQSNLGWE